ncbi:hypothetical protein EDB19DRAFT_1639038, partial [Suillus lakei]
QDWQNIFRHFNRDLSGSIDRNALRQFGYNLCQPLIEPVDAEYGTSPHPISPHSSRASVELHHSAKIMPIQNIKASTVDSACGATPAIVSFALVW